MDKNLIKVNFSVENYKVDLENYYQLIKKLFIEFNLLNKRKDLLENLGIPKKINNEIDLKNNKVAIDTINTLFKPVEIINNQIKKILNNWKSNFAGKKGLDNIILSLKNELIEPLKLEQLNYDKEIQEKILNEEISLKEQVKIKTTIGIKTYKNIIIDEININLLDKKYLLPNEIKIRYDIKNNNNIKIKGIKYHIEEIKK